MEPSKISDDVKERIRRLDQMSPDDWQQVLSVLTDKSREQAEMQPSLLSALNIRITYDLVNALERMDQTSAALSRKLLVLTWVLVAFTAVLLIEPAIHLIHWVRS